MHQERLQMCHCVHSILFQACNKVVGVDSLTMGSWKAFYSGPPNGRVCCLQVLVMTWLLVLAAHFIKGFLRCSCIFEMILLRSTVLMDLIILRTLRTLRGTEAAVICAQESQESIYLDCSWSQQPPENTSKVKDLQ